MKKVHARIGVFNEDVEMYCCCSRGEFAGCVMEKYGVDVSDMLSDSDGGYHAQLDGGDAGLVEVVWVKRFDGSPESMASLAHECIHVAVESMKARNVPVVPDGSSEMLAYLASSVMRDLLAALAAEEAGDGR